MLPAVNGQIQLEAQAKTRTLRFTLKEKFTFLSQKIKNTVSNDTVGRKKKIHKFPVEATQSDRTGRVSI